MLSPFILTPANVLIFPAKQAPHYKYGWPVSLALWVTCGVVIIALHFYDIKVIKPRNLRAAEEAAEEEESAARAIEPVKADDEIDHVSASDRPLV